MFSRLCFFLVYFLVFVFFSRIVSFVLFTGLAIAHARAKVETFNKELAPFGTSGTRSWGSFSLVCSFPYIQHTSVLELRFFKEGLPSSDTSGTQLCCFLLCVTFSCVLGFCHRPCLRYGSEVSQGENAKFQKIRYSIPVSFLISCFSIRSTIPAFRIGNLWKEARSTFGIPCRYTIVSFFHTPCLQHGLQLYPS